MKHPANVVSLSGGKDSTAMLLMLLERGEPVADVVFFDTGWEFPEMYEYLEKLEAFTGLGLADQLIGKTDASEFDGVAGATMSSDLMRKTIQMAVDAFQLVKEA